MTARARASQVLLWAVLALAALVLIGRLFFFGVYRVEKRSMEPTIHGAPEGGDVVLVWFDRGRTPERYELVVVQTGGGEEPLVKRAVGLPGEKLELRRGDVLIDGRKPPIDAPRPPPVPLFDSRLQEVEEHFDRVDEPGLWAAEGDVWHLDSRVLPPDTNLHRMSYVRRALDGWVDGDGQVEDGLNLVGDLVLDLEVRLGDPPARLRLGLLQMGDIFELELEPLGGRRWQAQLVQRWFSIDGAGEEVLASAELELVPDRWHRLRLVNVDDQVGLALDGRTRLLGAYPANHFHPQDPEGRRGVSIGPRAWFGGLDGCASFRRVRVSRDLHYTRRGERGVDTPIELGPEQVFVLGDNSAESRDSRDFGPLSLGRVLGRPTWILWPPSRIRRLSSPEPLLPPRR